MDNNRLITPSELLTRINKAESCETVIKGEDTFWIYQNILLCLINGYSFSILDNLNNKEFRTLYGFEYQSDLKKNNLKGNQLTFDELILKVKESKSVVNLYTSGTTGKPKRIEHKFSNLIRNVRIHEKFKSHTWALTYNPVHIGGLSVFFQAFLNKSSLLNCYGLFGKSLSEALDHHKVTYISATPTFYLNNLEEDKVFHHIQMVTLGGEIASDTIFAKLTRKFPNSNFRNIYATTESGTLLKSKNHIFSVENVDNVRIKENQIYYKEKKSNNWVNTGDLVEFIDSNKFIIVGRESNSYNVGGILVNLDAIQNLLLNSSAVKDCLVYVRPNKLIGNLICCDIILEEDAELNQIQNYILTLPNHLKPRKINIVNTLNISRNGKKIS